MSDQVVIACAPARVELLKLPFNDPLPDNCADCGKRIVVSKDARRFQQERNAKLLCEACVDKIAREKVDFGGPVPGEWQERVGELRQDVADETGEEGVLLAAWIVCNGCGKHARVFSDEDLAGWHLGGHRAGADLCPTCWARLAN